MSNKSTHMFSVNSSQISYIGYNEETNSLFITFCNGSTFEYYNVPIEKFTALKDTNSVGKYFNANIKNVYDNSKIK